ncbi:MAG: class I tRNA ligase family protein, partial [Planctomycetota bacterium]
EDYYLSWLENVRDWCISRQIWWGHRLPVYYCQNCDNIVVAREHPDRCPDCGHTELRQDEDVLDTWFSSALWPFSTLGWPEESEDLKTYYPTDTLVTDRGIIYFWVARMVMMGLELMDEVPFNDVLIHGTILDEMGRKMSKSLGNGIDPIEMIEQYGADAVRFSLIMLTTEGQDIKLSESKFEMGRNFANKAWNASRFTLMNLEEEDEEAPSLSAEELEMNRTFEDRWIMSRLAATVDDVNGYLEDFRTNEAAQSIYDFFWHELCDWYLEEAKLRLRDSDEPVIRACARETLARVLDSSLRLLHPFIPYMTEALWHQLKDAAERGAPLAAERMCSDALIVADWPESRPAVRDESLEKQMDYLQKIISAGRRMRKDKGIAENTPMRVVISCPDKETDEIVESRADFLKTMGLFEELGHGVDAKKPTQSAASVVETTEVFFELRGVIDIEEEKERLQDRKEDVTDHIAKIEEQLQNPDFIENAPNEVVQRQKNRADELREKRRKVIQNLAELED